MKFFRDPYQGWKIEFVYSPFFEMMCSLHVLYKPEHHLGRFKWAKDLREHMGSVLLSELDYFGQHYYEWCSAMDFCHISDVINGFSIVEALECIEDMEPDDFVYIMLNGEIAKEEIHRIVNGEQMRVPRGISEEQKNILRQPRRLQQRWIACLKEYYYKHFQEELRNIEPLLARTIKRHKIHSEKMDFLEYIKTLHSRIEISKNFFHFHKYKRFDVSFHQIEKVCIGVSSFIDPHLLLGVEEGKMLHLTIRANQGNKDLYEIPLDLNQVLKALAEPTRLKILKCIYKKPECTQTLAVDLGLTEACISKHFKVLFEAGLIDKHRQGNFIYYSINNRQIDKIPMDLYQYLDN
ncbi:MAG: metalloregulator ArsR/SmtB family transcription factor [Bacillota bacterium]